MSNKENIKEILNSNFSGFKDEIIETAANRIMEIIENNLTVETKTTAVVISDDFGHEIKGFYDKGRDMIFTSYGNAPRMWFDIRYKITEAKE